MREYTKSLEAVQQAGEHDVEHQHTREIAQQELKCQQALYSQQGEETQEQTLERAMRDPEVAVSHIHPSLPCAGSDRHLPQSIMTDPVMQQILQQAQNDPKALQDHMKNPHVRQNIQKLINAGIIRTRY
jgi:stress-induced-phosphoprotein 1